MFTTVFEEEFRMISEWARAVLTARRESKKIDRRIQRIEGGNYDRKPAKSSRKKIAPKQPTVLPDNGLGGGAAGTPT